MSVAAQMSFLSSASRVAPYVLAATVGAASLAWLRVLPSPVLQCWFAVSAPGWLVSARAGGEILDAFGRLLGIAPTRRQGWTTWWLNCCLAGWLRCNPHVSIKIDAESSRRWRAVPTTSPSVVLMNHTSFADAIVIGYHASWTYRANVKVVYKASLKNIPVFGKTFLLGGHFPVYFKGQADGDFSVDGRQAAVAVDMATYLGDGGRLMLFPEGVVNKTPAELQPFRHGTFKLLCAAKCPVYLLTMSGCEDLWPRTATVGGLPATVRMSFVPFETNYDEEDPAAMASRARAAMQRELDKLRGANNKPVAAVC